MPTILKFCRSYSVHIVLRRITLTTRKITFASGNKMRNIIYPLVAFFPLREVVGFAILSNRPGVVQHSWLQSRRSTTLLHFSDSDGDKNAAIFGGEAPVTDQSVDGAGSSPSVPQVDVVSAAATETLAVPTIRNGAKFLDEAARLRKEAADMEVALREEAREKGLPEEMINKLIPITSNTAPLRKEADGLVAQASAPRLRELMSNIRSKLGYLNTGDAVRVTSELDRIKGLGLLQTWNSKDISKANFNVNNMQLKTKTSIDPVDLKLDDVGYNYQLVLGAAVAIGTVCALAASQIGGELGFLLGYLSALLPIGLVGIGSVAPALIGDVINQTTYLIDAEARKRYVHLNAGKFLVGYSLGLPMARFSSSGPSNTVEFFQIRPSGPRLSVKEKEMFAKNKFKQSDIARSSVVCLGGAVAECIFFGSASGRNAADVNQLYELMTSCDPPLAPEQLQVKQVTQHWNVILSCTFTIS